MMNCKPSYGIELACRHLWTNLPDHVRNAYQRQVLEDTGSLTHVTSDTVERFYGAILTTAFAMEGNPYVVSHSQALNALHSATIEDSESVIQF